MSSSERRRPSRAVYRRRRLVVVLAFLLVVAAVALAFWRPWEGFTSGPSGDPTPPVTEAPSATTSPTSSASGTASPSPSPSPTGSTTAPSASADPDETEEPLAPCTAATVEVIATADQESYGAGESPQLGIQLTNVSDLPCAINVGTARQSFVISSGSDTWWRSTDCQVAGSDQVVRLEAGQVVTTVVPLVWDRTRSSVDTCDGPRQPAGAGYYRLAVSIGGIDGRETVGFQLR